MYLLISGSNKILIVSVAEFFIPPCSERDARRTTHLVSYGELEERYELLAILH